MEIDLEKEADLTEDPEVNLGTGEVVTGSEVRTAASPGKEEQAVTGLETDLAAEDTAGDTL